MKKISWLLVVAGFAALTPARAQDAAPAQPAAPDQGPDAALVEKVNKLDGYVQDLQDKTDAQRKQIDDLSKQIDDLHDQLNKPTVGAVTQDDLRKLADQLEEIDKKREADKELILKEIEALGKVSGGGSRHARKIEDTTDTETPATTATPANPNDKGFEYEVQSGDTISVIAKAYRDKGIKVSVQQIIDANPGLKPNSMRVGQKIFIPAPPGSAPAQ